MHGIVYKWHNIVFVCLEDPTVSLIYLCEIDLSYWDSREITQCELMLLIVWDIQWEM